MKVVNVSGLKNPTLGKEGGAPTGAAQLGANPLALGSLRPRTSNRLAANISNT